MPHSQAARFSRKDAGNWICSISSHPKINSCDVPQELGNDDIDARIAMGVECPFYDDDDLNPPAFIVHRDSPAPANATPAEATPATPAGALWTPEEDALLLGMRERGDTFTAISRALPGRSNSACSNRWGLLTRDPNEVRVKVPRQPRVLADPTEIEEQALEAMYAALRARFPGVELDGWRVEVTERKTGTSQGQLDKYYWAPPLPEGDSAGMSSPSMRFRSMTEVVNYVEARYVEGDDVEGKKVQPPDVAAKTPRLAAAGEGSRADVERRLAEVRDAEGDAVSAREVELARRYEGTFVSKKYKQSSEISTRVKKVKHPLSTLT